MLKKIIRPFTNPFFIFELDLDIQKMASDIENDIKKDDGVVKTNVGGWQSNDVKSTEAVKPLVNAIKNYSNILQNETGITKLFLVNLWVNINNKYNFNKPHIHGTSHLSGVFYVQTPEDSGKINFTDPRVVNSMNQLCKFKNHNLFNMTNLYFEPKANTMIIFPSYMSHYVEPSQSNETRISISFNMRGENAE